MSTPMKMSDLEKKARLAKRLDYTCIICGRHFENVACITREHIVPRSCLKGFNDARGKNNIEASHYRCNSVRGVMPLIKAQKVIDNMEKKLGQKQFTKWLNCAIPNRKVLPEAWLSPFDALWFTD